MAVVRWSVPLAIGAVLAIAAASADSKLPSLPPSKPGLYEFRGSSNGGIFRGKGAADLPEEELRRLADEALARSIPMFQLCVSDGSAKEMDPANFMGPDCTFSNIVRRRNGYTADARCTVGARRDVTHLAVETGTAEHRKVTLSMPIPGTSLSLVTLYEISRISSDCGEVPPGGRRKSDGKIIPSPAP